MDTLLTTGACTLPTTERPLRMAELDDLFTSAVRRVESRGRGIRLHLSGGEGLVERVRDLTAREASCCSFFSFAVEGSARALTLDVAVPEARQEVLDALAGRARELSA